MLHALKLIGIYPTGIYTCTYFFSSWMNQWWKCGITSYYLHVKSGDDSLNGIDVFSENCRWCPSCSSEIAANQYQPSLCHIISIYKVWWWYIHNFSFNWSDVVKMLSQQNLQVPSRRPFCFNLIAPKTKTSKVLWSLSCTSNLETIAWKALL